jgi:tRNA threonylcarbamoyladenosine biosynthesis protein TsaB
MKTLAVDTSTLIAGVAVLDGERVIGEARRKVTTHSEGLLALVDEVLRGAGLTVPSLDGFVCAAGPGSFTGLRIGLATVKGLCFATGKPLALVPSLQALALRAPGGAKVCATLDAYKCEVYGALYRREGNALFELWAERALAPAALAEELRAEVPLVIVGDGALRWKELCFDGVTLLDSDGAPHPGDVGRLGARRLAAGDHDDLAKSSPRYVRASEAELKAAQKALR